MRIAMGVSYHGNAYHGWQKQSTHQTQNGITLNSVQAELEKAIAQVADQPIKLICAGRTDTAVHALGQVVHFDCDKARSERSWLMGTNSYLPNDIAVLWVKEVSEEFHARYSALSRYYRYIIYNHVVRPVMLMKQITWCHQALNIDLMQEAAQALIGEHDFSSFRSSECQAKSPVRRIIELKLTKIEEQIIIDIRADAFLHHMVRNIAGVLMMIGTGQRAVSWCKQVLEVRDRNLGGVTAPPYGLYLVNVEYPEQFVIPQNLQPPLYHVHQQTQVPTRIGGSEVVRGTEK